MSKSNKYMDPQILAEGLGCAFRWFGKTYRVTIVNPQYKYR